MARPIALAASLLLLTSATAGAQQIWFVGSWRASIYGLSDALIMQPNGRYTETMLGPAGMTQETGIYTFGQPNMIFFRPLDWSPKTKPVYHPQGTVGGYVTHEPLRPPPGNTCRFQFQNRMTVSLQCLSLRGATIVYHRQ